MSTTAETTPIEKLIFAYAAAFNAKDLEKTQASYTPDGILMPNNAPLAKSASERENTFGFLFKNFNIEVEYNIDEVIVTGDHAYARTNSTVKTFVIATGETILLENKELFILRKEDGQWKISHYIFNNTKTIK